MKTWITDANNNRCSVEYWGSKEAAQRALDSLKDCSGCSECSECSDCFRCSDCSRCSRCFECSRCLCCFRGYKFSDCSGCYGFSVKQLSEDEPIPIIPDIHKAVYAAASKPGSLAMKHLHKCASTHCRAGWVITLAGEAGRALEKRFGWNLAAMKIYDASAPGYKINPCRFYDSNAEALADMKVLAEL